MRDRSQYEINLVFFYQTNIYININILFWTFFGSLFFLFFSSFFIFSHHYSSLTLFYYIHFNNNKQTH